MILKKITVANSGISKKEIVTPWGETIVLGTHGKRFHVIHTREEFNFFSRLRDILIVDPDVREIREYLEQIGDVPMVNKNVPEDEAKNYQEAKELEDKFKEELIQLGYDVTRIGADHVKSNEVSEVSDIALISEFTKRSKANPNILDAAKLAFNGYVSKELKDMSFEEVKQMMLQMGYVGLRKKEEG